MYKPSEVPYESKALVEYLNRELHRLAGELNKALNQQMIVYNEEPDRPRDGLYYADGTNWNPGSGRGLYRYDEVSSTFTFIG